LHKIVFPVLDQSKFTLWLIELLNLIGQPAIEQMLKK